MMGGIHPDQARAVWPLAAPILARAIVRTNGRFTLQAALDLVEAGKMQLWLGGDTSLESVALTELLPYPGATAVRVVFAAGRLDQILATQPLLDGWARENGATSIEIEGRAGWARVAPGYVQESVLLRRQL